MNSFLVTFIPIMFLYNMSSNVDGDLFALRIDNQVENSYSLTCLSGCAWKTITISCVDQPCAITVHQYGANAGTHLKSRYDETSFQIDMTVRGSNYRMTCITGCDWSDITYVSVNQAKGFILDQQGARGL